MPLIKSPSKSAFETNLKTEIAAGKPKNQALAIAYRMKRGYADGGTPYVPFAAREEARGLAHAGAIHGITGGRADRVPMSVGSGSYVIPADVVSGIGQGNSGAGHAALSSMFKIGPYGSSGMGHMGISRPAMPKIKLASGGVPQGAGDVPILASDGEFVVPPEKVQEIGGGDMKRGHDILDEMVKHVRSKTIKKLKSLPAPKKK